EKQKREEEAREKARRAAWPGMHAAQHQEELEQQGKSLEEDIATSELNAAQLRVQMFDKALTIAGPPRAFGAELTPAMRNTWLVAQQATMALEALLHATTTAVPAEVTAPVRDAYIAFFDTLTSLVAAQDRATARLQEQATKILEARSA